jgi:hypothetical protein
LSSDIITDYPEKLEAVNLVQYALGYNIHEENNQCEQNGSHQNDDCAALQI